MAIDNTEPTTAKEYLPARQQPPELSKSINETARILCAIPEKASISIKALLDRLEENRPPWTQIRDALMTFEAEELLTIQHNKGMITAVQLTPLGAERAREAQRANR